MPFGIKYEEPDELDPYQKGEILYYLNPSTFEKRARIYSNVIQLLRYYGYRRAMVNGVYMIKDDEPDAIHFRKNKFDAKDLECIPEEIQFAIYVMFYKKMRPDISPSYEFQKEIVEVLQQRSKKVKKRIMENIVKFLFWNGYKYDAGNFVHSNYPPIRDGNFDLNYVPYHIQLALWGYFVLPKLKGRQLRMFAINCRKKQCAMQRRMKRYAEQVEKERLNKEAYYLKIQQTYTTKQKEIEQFEKDMKSSGF